MHAVNVADCFGWLHKTAAPSDVAVVLCTALGDEAATAHRQLRLLAKDIADAGYPTLRFDYAGTGDSCDVEPGTLVWSVWLDSIHAVMDWLRRVTGASRIVLCGLRMGATLAAIAAAQRTDLAGLILLSPGLRGRSFIRQMEIEAKLAGTQRADGCLEAYGLVLSTPAVTEIASVDLVKLALPAGCQVIVFSAAESPILDQCVENWRQNGAVVTTTDFAELTQFLRPTFMSHEPPVQVSRVTRWLRQAVPPRTAFHVAIVPPPCVLRQAGYEETPAQFGVDKALFGLICRPVVPGRDQAVLIVSSGGHPRYGYARQAVDLARRFAQAGITSLRMDFAGLGDSLAPGDGETHVFETDRRAEISAGLDALARLGYHRFAVLGVCSGAYHAFHAGVADDRIGTLLLVNFPMFQWPTRERIENFSFVLDTPQRIVGTLGKLESWRKLLTGQVDIAGRLALQLRWWTKKAGKLAGRAGRRIGLRPRLSFAQSAVQTLARRSRTLLLMTPGEGGIALLADELGANGTTPGVTTLIVPDIDHSLTTKAIRGRAFGLMLDFLAAKPVPPPG